LQWHFAGCLLAFWSQSSAFRATHLLPCPTGSTNLCTVAAKSATGFRSPNHSSGVQRLHTHCRRFFSPALSIYGGCAWGTFGCAGCLTVRSANPRTAATLLRFAARGGGFITPSGAAPWSSRPPIRPCLVSRHHPSPGFHRTRPTPVPTCRPLGATRLWRKLRLQGV